MVDSNNNMRMKIITSTTDIHNFVSTHNDPEPSGIIEKILIEPLGFNFGVREFSTGKIAWFREDSLTKFKLISENKMDEAMIEFFKWLGHEGFLNQEAFECIEFPSVIVERFKSEKK